MEAVAQAFTPFVERLLSQKRQLRRLAFGCILLRPVAVRDEILPLLLDLLPDLRIDRSKPVRDLFYQINRPRMSRTKGGPNDLEINRLSKWSGVELRQAYISLDGSPRGFLSQPTQAAARLELDISSNVQLSRLIPNAITKPLFHEFVDLGKELATRGDHP
jgi:hypothetical protein